MVQLHRNRRIKTVLLDENELAILPDGMDGALIGISRVDGTSVGVYSFLKYIESLMDRYDLTEEAAISFYENSLFPLKIDENYPIFVDDTGV